jgi:hypothetical protein
MSDEFTENAALHVTKKDFGVISLQPTVITCEKKILDDNFICRKLVIVPQTTFYFN